MSPNQKTSRFPNSLLSTQEADSVLSSQALFPDIYSLRHCIPFVYIMLDARLDELQTSIKIAGENINNLRYADGTNLMVESEEKLKSLLMKVKEESGKADLKLNIQKTKIMESGPITSWQIDGETVTDLILAGLQKSLQMVTASMKLKDACSLEEKL